jgi:hypothetical protein
MWEGKNEKNKRKVFVEFQGIFGKFSNATKLSFCFLHILDYFCLCSSNLFL